MACTKRTAGDTPGLFRPILVLSSLGAQGALYRCMPTTALIRDARLDHFVAEAKHHPLMSRAEELVIARRFHLLHDPADAKRLALANLRFVLKIAHEFSGYRLNLSDLVQEGNVGLLVGITKFDPERGFRLISYVVWWIRASIWNYVMRNSSIVRMPTSAIQRRLFFRLREARRALEQRVGGEVTLDAVAQELHVDVAQIEEAYAHLGFQNLSLDDDEHTRDPMLGSAATQETALAEKETLTLKRKWVTQAMGQLDDRERSLIQSRFYNDEPETLNNIGKRFNVSRERVRQIEARALSKMKPKLAGGPSELRG